MPACLLLCILRMQCAALLPPEPDDVVHAHVYALAHTHAEEQGLTDIKTADWCVLNDV